MKSIKIIREVTVVALRLLLINFFLHEEILEAFIVEIPFLSERLYVVYNKLKKLDNNSLNSKCTIKQVSRLAFFVLLTTIVILNFQQDKIDKLLLKILLRSLPLVYRLVIDSTHTTIKKRLRQQLNNRNRQ